MGFKLEKNHILKLDISESDLENLIKEGTSEFSKEENREYPTNMYLFLADSDWNALGIIKVRNCMYGEGRTIGTYELKRTLDETESEVLTNLFREMYGK